jgi:hypothetical protein
MLLGSQTRTGRGSTALEGVDATGRPIHARNKHGEAICGSPLRKKPGKICHKTMLAANGRCDLHGGKTPYGLAHPRWSASKFAGALDPVRAEQLMRFLEDPNYLSLQEEIAMTDVEQLDLYLELNAIDPSAMRKMIDLHDAMNDAADFAEATGDNTALVALARDVAAYGRAVTKRNALRGELRETRKHRKELVEVEMTRIWKGRTQVPIDRVFALITSIALVIRSAVMDILPKEYHTALLMRIQRDVNRLLPTINLGGSQASNSTQPQSSLPAGNDDEN